MSDDSIPDQPWNDLETLVEKRDESEVLAYLSALPPADVARAISRLSEESRGQLLMLIEPREAADLIEELPESQGAEMIEELPAEQAAAIVDELESDHRADILSELDYQDADAILSQMDPEEAADARKLMEYEPNTAGGLMITEFVSYSDNLHVQDVLDDLRMNAAKYADYAVQYTYVTNAAGRLVGVLRLHDLVLSHGEKPLKEAMIVNPISVLVDSPLDELEQLFDRFQFSALPVVEHDGSIVGVVQRVDTEEALSERAERTFMRWSGIFGGDEMRHLPLRKRSMGRLWWLGINLTLSFVSASIIILFQGTVNKVVALAAIIPILANVTGCSGNQAVAVSIREMTLGLAGPRDLFRVIAKELSVGLVNGLILGTALGAVVFFWQNDLTFGIVVAVAMTVNMAVSVILGGCIPLIMRRLGIDPAIASPMLTTFVDMCGFFLILSLATLLLM